MYYVNSDKKSEKVNRSKKSWKKQLEVVSQQRMDRRKLYSLGRVGFFYYLIDCCKNSI